MPLHAYPTNLTEFVDVFVDVSRFSPARLRSLSGARLALFSRQLLSGRLPALPPQLREMLREFVFFGPRLVTDRSDCIDWFQSVN